MSTRLRDELVADPSAVFEIRATLPSGNVMSGTVGPLIGDRVCSRIEFSVNPSDEDTADAIATMDELMGGAERQFLRVAKTAKEGAEAIAARRRFLGGGQG